MKVYVDTFKQLKLAILTIALMLGLAALMNYSGMTSTMGLALAGPASSFRSSAPSSDGSACSSPAATRRRTRCSATCRSSPPARSGLNPILTASVNSAAGVMGKMISVQSIAVAVAATGMSRDDESRLFRFTIKHSVLLMVVMAIISMLYAYVFPGLVPHRLIQLSVSARHCL